MHTLPSRMDDNWLAVIEAAASSRSKYKFETPLDAFVLHGVLPTGTSFPYAFGFVPSTLGEDGDPLDIVVLTDEAPPVACVVPCRIVAVLQAEQLENGKRMRNDRLLGVAVASERFRQCHARKDVDAKISSASPVSSSSTTPNKASASRRSAGKAARPPSPAWSAAALLTMRAAAADPGATAWQYRRMNALDAPSVCSTDADCRLGQSIDPQTAERPGLSGILLLNDGRDAFAARVLLADAAERTLDVQYYIWHDDLSGTLLLDALRRAADRGVRVRLLLDDNNTAGLDGLLVALDSHPQIEVRLFNAFRYRRWRWLGFLTDFARLNRRMHNKSFTVDARATIVGGRNVGDEYFGASRETLFIDLDVLAVGAVVGAVSSDFDRYWSSPAAAPVRTVLTRVADGALAACKARAASAAQHADARAYAQAIAELPIVSDLLLGTLSYTWAAARMISDDPAKALAHEKQRDLVIRRLQEVLGDLQRELYLISPYFVPSRRGSAFFATHARSGVRVSVLTNSLEATDVIAVHAGYIKRRKELLRAGVRLFELRRSAPTRKHLLRMRGSSASGSSGSSLHSKTFSIDRERLFVGSFNFDQRSARLNTEMGFIIDSPALAQAGADAFDAQVPDSAYEVQLQDGRLRWIERNEDGETVHNTEPGTTRWQRIIVRVLSWLPIEWML